MLVIGLVGPKAAGKETIAEYIAKRYIGRVHSHSEILDEILAILRIPNSRENEIKLVELRRTFGENTLIRGLNKKIKSEKGNLVCVTGIRFENEMNNIRSYPDNKIIYVDAPADIRFERIQKRGEKPDDSQMSYQKFIEIESQETEVHTKELGKKADFRIGNTGSTEQLYREIDGIMKQIYEVRK